MLKKILFLLFAGFAIQFLISCDMNCNPGPTVEMEYTDLRIDLRVNIDNQISPIEDSVQKENFNLFVGFDIEEKKMASRFLNFGFNKAHALYCGPYYIYPNRVESMTIVMINSSDPSEERDVTDIFGKKTDSYTNSVQELINIQSEEEDFENYFNMSLIESENLFKSGSFEITATLESGTVFTTRTQQVTFY